MYDLSWLNPTPHAIAVYASQPLSPVATQHSLSSGRYSLLGPDLHRLDRTSLRLAHLFDHLVGACEQRRGGGGAQRPGRLEVCGQLEHGGLLYWYFGRFAAPQYLLHDGTSATPHVMNVGGVGHQTACVDIFSLTVDRRQCSIFRKRHQRAPRGEQ